MKKTITSLSILLILGGAIYQLYANSNGASSQTTAPGEVTCSQSGCHGAGNGEGSSGGLADNTGGGSVAISGISGTYAPGAVYHMTVTVNQTGGGKFGFNCEALDASNGNAGTITATQSGTYIRTGVNGTRNTISHGHSGTSGPIAGIGTNSFVFYFDWTAPASSVGTVTFYATGLAVNMNGLNDSGDEVYSSTLMVSPSVAPSAQILLSRSTFTFPSFYALPSTVGNMQGFWAAGVGLSGNLTASVTGTQFQIATSAAGPWVTSIPLTASGGVVSGTAIYVQYTGPATGTQTGTVTISGGGAASKTIPLSGVIRTGGTAPSISAPSPSAINFGTVAVGSGNATTPQTFTYTTANPVSGLTLTASAGYEISSNAGYDYNSVLTPVFFGVGFTNVVYVRLKNPQTAGTFNGNVTVALTGATTQTISLTAIATTPAQLVLASTDNLSLFTSTPGTPSFVQSFSVNGSGLTSTLDVNSCTNFDVSLSPSSGFGPSVSITPTGGNVAPTAIYVRYNNPAAGLDANSLTVVSTGANPQFVRVNGDCFGSSTAGINNISKKDYITVYPNPSSGLVSIKSAQSFEQLFVTVIDVNGRIVLSEKLNANAGQIDLSNHTSGIYFVNIMDGNKNMISTQKVILRK